MTSAQLGFDVSTDNDPRENGAHAQWRATPLGFGHPTVEPVEARVYLAMADEPPALVGSVLRMLAALLVVVVGIKAVALDHPLAWTAPIELGQADAAVAVLLIVPGVLLARLDIFSTHSILGRLRRFPIVVAYVSVGITSTLALFVAAEHAGPSKRLSTVFMIGSGALLVLLMLCVVESVVRFVRRRVPVPRSAAVPVWLRRHYEPGAGRRGALLHPDVYFDAIRPLPAPDRESIKAYEQSWAEWRWDSSRVGPPATEGPALLAELTARAVSRDYKAAWIEVLHDCGELPGPLTEDGDDLLYVAFAGSSCQIRSGYRQDYDRSGFHCLRLGTHRTGPRAARLPRWDGRRPQRSRRRSSVPTCTTSTSSSDSGIWRPSRLVAGGCSSFLNDALTCADGISHVVPTLVLAPAISATAEDAGESSLSSPPTRPCGSR